MIPAMSMIVVLPNHIRKLINAIIPRAVPTLLKKSTTLSASPPEIIWFIGPTLENNVKNSIANAAAMIRLGR